MNDQLLQKLRDIPVSDLAVISDLDDTLLNDAHALSDENRSAIREFIEMGGRFAIATGRSELGIAHLNIPTNAVSILYNGAALYDLRSAVFCHICPLGMDARDFAEKVLRDFPSLGMEITTLTGTYVPRGNKEVDHHLAMEHLHPSKYGCPLDEIPSEWMKIMLETNAVDILDLKAYLDDLHARGQLPFNYAFSYDTIIEILHEDGDKGAGIRHFSRETGIPFSHIIAMGDAENDLSMMQNAGIRVVPSNASPALIEIADYVSVDHEDHIMQDLVRILRSRQD